MTTNIIIGKKSFVTKSLLKYLNKAEVFSANNLNETSIGEICLRKKINIIFNNFYPSKLLNNLSYEDYRKFEKLSLNNLTLILSKISPKKVNKIIYTSSAAVYRLAENINDQKKDEFNRTLYSSFKLASEKIILNYCTKNNVNYNILRLFNSFGDPNDQFSFIEKIIKSKKNKQKISLINDGSSIRDFIHVNDIGNIFNIFIKKNANNGIYDIGTGKGFLIKDIVNLANFHNKFIKKINDVEEIYNSIANVENLKKVIGNYKFKNLGNYIKSKLSIKNKKVIYPVLNFKNKTNILSGVVIYGAGFAGKQIFAELKKLNENVLFFVDDNLKLQNKNFEGTPIISYENLLVLNKSYNIKGVYLTIPSLSKNLQNKVINKIKKNFFDVRYLSEKKFLLSNNLNINDLNINEINNILNRKQIKIKKINKLAKKTIIVTGAAGTIGSEICRQLLQHKVKKIIAIDKSEIGIYNQQGKLKNKKIIYKLLDINDKFFLEQVIKKEKVELIFHAAAYKHVNILEENIFSAVKNNILATYNLCELSIKYSCEMIFISTDKAANPTSVLGYTKKTAEKVCKYFNSINLSKKKIKIVRFGNVFGSSGSAVNNFIDKINNEKPLQITSKKAYRYFMTVSEACHLVLQTTSIKSNKSIFILNMGTPINIFMLAKKLAEIKSNQNPNYKFKYVVIGLQPGEKLKETLKGKRESIKKLNNEMFEVTEDHKTRSEFTQYYQQLLEKYYNLNNNEVIKHLKKISKY